MKEIITFILSAILGAVIVFFLMKSCKPKPKYIQGKSYTVVKKDTAYHFAKEDRPKPKIVYYPKYKYLHDTVNLADSILRRKLDSMGALLAIRVYLDTTKIGKATITRYDSVQGSILKREIGCLGCGFDTVNTYRVDTLKPELPSKFSFGAHLGVTFGINLLPPYAPCLCAGVGAGVNYKLTNVYR